MIDKSELLNDINSLCNELIKTGKIDTANYFKKYIVKIEKSKNDVKLKKVMGELYKTGTIVQYADFTYKEEGLYNKVIEIIGNHIK